MYDPRKSPKIAGAWLAIRPQVTGRWATHSEVLNGMMAGSDIALKTAQNLITDLRDTGVLVRVGTYDQRYRRDTRRYRLLPQELSVPEAAPWYLASYGERSEDGAAPPTNGRGSLRPSQRERKDPHEGPSHDAREGSCRVPECDEDATEIIYPLDGKKYGAAKVCSGHAAALVVAGRATTEPDLFGDAA